MKKVVSGNNLKIFQILNDYTGTYRYIIAEEFTVQDREYYLDESEEVIAVSNIIDYMLGDVMVILNDGEEK